MLGDLDDKIRGLQHVWHNVWGSASDPVKLYEPSENRACLERHEGARSYAEHAAHEPHRTDLLEGAKSCLICHNLIHETAKLDRFQRWDPEAKR